MTLQTLAQILASGLLMGLIYALIAAGLSLIFGLMDVVNFAHGEFLMLAMYATFGIVVGDRARSGARRAARRRRHVRARRLGLSR